MPSYTEDAARLLPLWGGTYSKSPAYWPDNAPFFQDHDLIDWTSALGTRIIPGMLVPLSPPLSALPVREEVDLARYLNATIPCAEQIRYFKGASDALQTAVRIARAATARSRIAVCGYHGWHEWYAGSTARDLGCSPQDTHHFKFGELPTLSCAAVIVEPVRTEANDKWLHELATWCVATGSLLVFDETLSGFRFHRGGWQARCNVIPDMAVFGKAIANGFPLAVLVGERRLVSIPVFASPTFATERMSLAAAIGVQEFYEDHAVAEKLDETGTRLREGLVRIFGANNVKGLPAWTIISYPSDEFRTAMCMKMIEAGHLVNGQHFINWDHTASDVDDLLAAYNWAAVKVRHMDASGELEKPEFRVCRTILSLPGRP